MQKSSQRCGRATTRIKQATNDAQHTHDAPTVALSPVQLAHDARRAAAEALATIVDRLFYLGQLAEVSTLYAVPLAFDATALAAPTVALLDLAEQVQAADLLTLER